MSPRISLKTSITWTLGSGNIRVLKPCNIKSTVTACLQSCLDASLIYFCTEQNIFYSQSSPTEHSGRVVDCWERGFCLARLRDSVRRMSRLWTFHQNHKLVDMNISLLLLFHHLVLFVAVFGPTCVMTRGPAPVSAPVCRSLRGLAPHKIMTIIVSRAVSAGVSSSATSSVTTRQSEGRVRASDQSEASLGLTTAPGHHHLASSLIAGPGSRYSWPNRKSSLLLSLLLLPQYLSFLSKLENDRFFDFLTMKKHFRCQLPMEGSDLIHTHL